METLLDPPAESIASGITGIDDELTRRGVLCGALSGAGLLALSACGSAGPDDAASAGAAWSFVDDLGRKVKRSERPTRVATLDDGWAATLWSAGLHVVAAPLNAGNKPFWSGAGVDPAAVRAIGAKGTSLASSIDVEALAAAKPDLIVDSTTSGKLLISPAIPAVAKIAPVVGLNQNGPDVAGVIGHGERLVTALGLNLADKDERARFQTSEGRLRRALAAKPGLRAMFCFSGGTTGVNLMSPTYYAFIATLSRLGMRFVTPPGSYDRQGNVAVGFEQLPSLPVDLILFTGPGIPSSNPAWLAMPAVRAGQVADTGIGWYAYYYGNYAAMLDKLTATVGTARTGVGPT